MITSLDNPKIKYIIKLKDKKYRNEFNEFIVEGTHLINEAKALNILIEAYSINEIDGYIQVSEAVMKKICQTDTVVKEIGICKMINKKELSDRILILDRIQDPGNLGSLLRSAKAFGFETIFLSKGSVDIYNDKAIRSSQGAIFKLNFINGDIIEFINNITKDGYNVYGTNVVNGISIDDVKKCNKIALILGNEGRGISKEVFDIVKQNIYIPLNNTESLNVLVAGSILMYEINKKFN